MPIISINAQNVNGVNARSANGVGQDLPMGKQPENEPSDFWRRLTDAWKTKGLPTTQNGVATKLSKSQGSVQRWFRGYGYPEIDVLREIARLGSVTIDWLLMDTLPRSPVGKTTSLGKLMLVWEELSDDARNAVYRNAMAELALQEHTTDGKPHAVSIDKPTPLLTTRKYD